MIHYTGGSQGASSYLVPGRSEQLCHCFLPTHKIYRLHFPSTNLVQIFARPSLCTSTSPRTNQCNVGYKSLHSVTLTLQGLTDRHRSLTDCTGRAGAITSTIPFYSQQALKLLSALRVEFLFGLRTIFSRQSLE